MKGLTLLLLFLGDAEGWRAGNPSIPFFDVVSWWRTSSLPVPIDVLEKRRISIQSVQSQKICCCRFGSVGYSWFELAVAACQFLFVAVVEWLVFKIGKGGFGCLCCGLSGSGCCCVGCWS